MKKLVCAFLLWAPPLEAVRGPLAIRTCYRDEDFDVVSQPAEREQAFLCVTVVPCEKAEMVIRLGRGGVTHYESKSTKECQ